MDAVSEHPVRRQNSPTTRPLSPALTSLVNDLASARRADGPDGDPLPLTARWSTALSDRLDDNLAATGSVGRGEATPASDLDAIRLAPGPTPGFTGLLTDGIIGDDDGVSPATSVLPGDRAAWTAALAGWCARPGDDRGVVKTGLVADAADPVGELPRAAAAAVPGTPMVTEMLRDALSHTPPRTIGLFHADSFALKEDLLTPVVKISRWAALTSGSAACGTVTRLTDAAAAGLLGHTEAVALRESYRAGLALALDLALGTGPTSIFERRGRVVFSALPRERSQRLRRAVTDLRGVQRTLRYRLSTSSYTEF